jgi:peptide/nickel transport system permease protein
VFRNSLLPLVTLFAGLLPGLIGGSIIVEYIFSINGMGSLSILALTSRDYPLMMALFTIGALLTLLGILISDLLYAVVDPRITYE